MNSTNSLIKKYRKEKGLTQQELANKIGKNVKSIQRYETGINPIPIDVLNKIAGVLNIGIDKLIYDEDDSNDYRYDSFIKLMLSIGYTIEEIPLYTGGQDLQGYPTGEWETALILKKDRKELQLNIDDVNILFDNIENFINFTINSTENSKEFQEQDIIAQIENNIDEYYNDDFIEKIKEKIGYYGGYAKPLNTAEKIVWEMWKENNIYNKK